MPTVNYDATLILTRGSPPSAQTQGSISGGQRVDNNLLAVPLSLTMHLPSGSTIQVLVTNHDEVSRDFVLAKATIQDVNSSSVEVITGDAVTIGPGASADLTFDHVATGSASLLTLTNPALPVVSSTLRLAVSIAAQLN